MALVAVVVITRSRRLPPPPLDPPRIMAPRVRGAAEPRAVTRPPARSAHAASGTGVRGEVDPNGTTEAAPDRRPRVAIVIDDLGDSLAAAHPILALRPAVTVAVIPFRADSRAVATAAVQAGREVILHLPLEPEATAAMGDAPGFLRTGMSADGLERALDAGLRAVPYIVGVNGHMGSRFTSDPRAMRVLLGALRARGLFYLDSLTSPDSVAGETAARLGVPFAARSMFLDHTSDPAAIARALDAVAARARREGEVIAIGHPRRATVAALADWLPAAERAGLAIVPLSALVR